MARTSACVSSGKTSSMAVAKYVACARAVDNPTRWIFSDARSATNAAFDFIDVPVLLESSSDVSLRTFRNWSRDFPKPQKQGETWILPFRLI